MKIDSFSEQIFLRNYRGLIRFMIDNLDFNEENNLIKHYTEALNLEWTNNYNISIKLYLFVILELLFKKKISSF